MPATRITDRGYADPSLLVETDWLETHLHDGKLRLIDTRSPQLYEAGHIPGAVNLAAYGGIPRAENGDMGSAEDFSRLGAELGVSVDSTVVIYDAPGAQMGMAAWAFSYYGHRDVHILDGGFEKWISEGGTTSTEPGGYPGGQFQAELVEELYCSLDDAKAAHGTSGTVFWDVRTQAEYEGSQAGNNSRPGHIPGAVHLEWTELLDPETKTFKSAQELRELLGGKGITPESEIACY